MSRPDRGEVQIAIVGGGITGAALACALGARGLEVALLDERGPAARYSEPLRVSSLAPGSQAFLSALGAWPDAETSEPRPQPFLRMRVWDAEGWGGISFDAAEFGRSELGWIVANESLRTALWRRLADCPTVQSWSPARLQRLQPSADGGNVVLSLDDGRRLHALLAVGADGGGSLVRRLAGLPTLSWDYRQRGIVVTVATELEHQHTAWQRFLPTGPLAFLPLADGRCSVVWSMHSERVDALLALAESDLAERLAAALDYRLGAVRLCDAPAAFPLYAQTARRYVSRRVALIGDAAHVVHPLAGQGVNLGLLDARALAAVIITAGAGADPGALPLLRRYQRRRRADNLLMLHALDGLARLFGNALPPLRAARNLGLNLTDASGPLKRLLARRAMGIGGEGLL